MMLGIMETISSERINELENNIQQLKNLMELTFISNHYREINSFLMAFSKYLKEIISNITVDMLCTGDDRIMASVDNSNNSVKIDLLKENFMADLDEFPHKNNYYYFAANKGKRKKEKFLSKYNIKNENIDGIRIFVNNDYIFAAAFVSAKEGADVFAKDKEFLLKIFDYIEPALLKHLYQKKEKEEIKDLHKSLNKISVLYSISQAVNFIDDLKHLLKVVLNKALETVQAEKASLMFYDFSDNSLQIKFVCGLSDKNLETDINNGLVECAKIKVNEGIAGTVFAQKKSIICNLGQNDPRFVATDVTSYADNLLCVPLISKGEAIGVFNISNKKDGKLFNRSDLEFMEALASQAAIAIDNSKLYELATKDGLTKLYIYRHFCTLFENEIRRASRYDHPVNFIMLDIDNFKKVNDTYGHLIGDQVLREVSSTIAKSVRKIDIAARYGGEEFAVILPETDANIAKKIANRIRMNVSKIDVEAAGNAHIKPTVSIGIAEFPTCADDGITLIELADIALYQAKTGGKNIVYEYTPFGCQRVDENFGVNSISD